MANSELESLKRELIYYTNLLENHESLKGQTQPSVSRQMAAWKQPQVPVHKIVKNTNPPQSSYNKLRTYKSNPYFVKINKSNPYSVSPNNRTVLFNQNQNKYLKAENSAELSKQTTRSVQFSASGFENKRTVLPDKKRRTVINSNNITDKALTASNTSEKVTPSDFQALLKNIEVITQQLKKTSEIKSRIINLNIKEIKEDKQMVKESHNIVATNKNLSSSHKQVNNCNINSKKTVLKSSTHQFKNPMMYKCKKNDIKPTLYFKTNENPLKFVKEKVQVVSNSKQSISGIKINVPNTSVPNDHNTVELKALTIDRRQAVDKKLNMDECASNFKAVLKGSLSLSKVKSPVSRVKSPIISREKRKYGSVYRKINKRQSAISSKNQFKTNSSPHKTVAGTKMEKGNSYKFVNKMNALPSKEKLKLKNNSVSNENFLMPVDESDPLFKLLHDNNAIDKLEQDLLVITSSLTDTSKQPVTKKQHSNNKIYQCSTKKVNSKFCLKKTPLKRSKIFASKYKFVNKTLQLSQNYVKTKNTSFKPSVKKLNKIVSKFSVVNKHPKSMLISPPVSKENSVLVKRLYKSKSTIINKNDSPTSQSAKIIKSKYLALIKRKSSSSWQKHILYPKMPLRQQKFKGHFVTRRHSRQNQYKKSRNLHYLRGARKFSNYGNSIINKPYSKNFSGSMYQKQKYAYVQKPVRVIRGVRYSLSSSGKQLRKLPTRGQTQIRKLPKRVIIAGKSYIRTSENVMKTTSPTNLASRVLHRSINRVLIASTKKNLTKVNTYCMFYNRFGRCNRGVKCTYIHDPSKIAVCTRFLRRTCKIDGCPFSHEVAPGKMAICSFFLVDACEKDDCPYRHEKLSPDATLCKAFVQGYCPNGKRCNKAHILICPKFIQGECEKGSSCAFPHPPPKVKRTVQKEVVGDKEVEKPEDALLENVARYFQPLFEKPLPQCHNSTIRNDTISFVPQRRKLEEQPPFIPLCDTPVTPKNFQPGILGE